MICVGQFNGIDIDPDGKMVTVAECDELVSLLRKWPEPDACRDALRETIDGVTIDDRNRTSSQAGCQWRKFHDAIIRGTMALAMTASPQEER